jgi:hypothetical protein
MSQFSTLPERACTALRHDLDQSPAWASIPEPVEGDGAPARLSELPRRVGWKLRVVWAVNALLAALSVTDAATLRAADEGFDTPIRRLHLKLTLDLTDPDPDVRAAAARAQALLLPNGLTPINLPYDDEVDWGRNCADRAATLAPSDLTRLGLTPFLDAIAHGTAQLARALGIAPGKPRDLPKNRRIRAALAECQRAFKATYTDLRWHLDHAQDPAERADLSNLIAAFDLILTRYSVATPKP